MGKTLLFSLSKEHLFGRNDYIIAAKWITYFSKKKVCLNEDLTFRFCSDLHVQSLTFGKKEQEAHDPKNYKSLSNSNLETHAKTADPGGIPVSSPEPETPSLAGNKPNTVQYNPLT